MITIHAMWILLMITAAYFVGMVVGWFFTKQSEDRPMAIKKDYGDDDYMQQVYGDMPNWLRRQAD